MPIMVPSASNQPSSDRLDKRRQSWRFWWAQTVQMGQALTGANGSPGCVCQA